MKRLMSGLVLAACAGTGVANAQGVGSVMARADGTIVAPTNLEARIVGIAGSVAQALAFAETGRVVRLHDSQNTRLYQTMENGTGTVWAITGPFTNYNVSLSPNFAALPNNERPSWTTHDWPFEESLFRGFEDTGTLYINGPLDADVRTWSSLFESWPCTLTNGADAQGSATVSQNVYYVTNVISRYATEERLNECYGTVSQDIAVVSGVISNVSDDIYGFMATNVASLQPQTRTLYGNLAITNQAGYGSFADTNAAQAVQRLIAAASAGTNTASLLWPIAGGRTYQASATAYASGGGASGVGLIEYVNSAMVPVSSNATATATFGALAPYFTNSLIFTASTSGYVRLTYTVARTSAAGNASALYTGGATPLSLQVTQAPLEYVTTAEAAATYVRNSGGAATNLMLAGSFMLTNGLAITGGWSNVYPTVRIRWGTTNLNIVVRAPE